MNASYINIPEGEHEIIHTIQDKFGDVYTIRGHLSPSGLISYVDSETYCIGCINWDTSQHTVMIIADLHIFEPRRIKPWSYIFLFLYKEPINYRGRGLGYAMLEFIIATARIIGVSEIRGWITEVDLKATPYLPTFYRKHGFTVDDNNLTFYQAL